jgi:hypothetical protein
MASEERIVPKNVIGRNYPKYNLRSAQIALNGKLYSRKQIESLMDPTGDSGLKYLEGNTLYTFKKVDNAHAPVELLKLVGIELLE